MSGAPDSSDHPKIGARTVRLGQVWEAASKLAAAQVPKQLSGSTRRATISVGLTTSLGYGSPSSLHDRFVHPDAPPPSHLRSRSKLGIICCLVSVILAIAISLVIVFGEFPLGDIWHQPANNHSWTRLKSGDIGNARRAGDPTANRPVIARGGGGTRTARPSDPRAG